MGVSFREHIRKTSGCSKELAEFIESRFSKKIFTNGKYLLKSGHFCENYYYVQSGALRIFYFVEEKEITSWIAFEGTFFTDLESYSNNLPSIVSIIATEDSEVYCIQRKKMEKLLQEYPEWQIFLRRTWELAFLKLSHVVHDLQTKKIAEIYEKIIKNKDISQRVKLKDLSTMIGSTPFSISRIRRKKS